MKTSKHSASSNRLLKPFARNNTPPSLADIGTLWTLGRSPFSKAVKVVLALSGRTVKEISFTPVLSAISLSIRLGLSAWRDKITAPVLRLAGTRPAVYLTESLDTASYIDELREVPQRSLFPPEQRAKICSFNSVAGIVISFMRAQLISRLKSDLESCEKMFVPRRLQGWFFTKPIVILAMWSFSRKYAEESRNATQEKVISALDKVRDALVRHEGRHLRYLCGGRLTYADIIVAESLFFDERRHGNWGYLYRNEDLAERFPDLIAWGRAVRETHYKDSLITKKI